MQGLLCVNCKILFGESERIVILTEIVYAIFENTHIRILICMQSSDCHVTYRLSARVIFQMLRIVVSNESHPRYAM